MEKSTTTSDCYQIKENKEYVRNRNNARESSVENEHGTAISGQQQPHIHRAHLPLIVRLSHKRDNNAEGHWLWQLEIFDFYFIFFRYLGGVLPYLLNGLRDALMIACVAMFTANLMIIIKKMCKNLCVCAQKLSRHTNRMR